MPLIYHKHQNQNPKSNTQSYGKGRNKNYRDKKGKSEVGVTGQADLGGCNSGGFKLVKKYKDTIAIINTSPVFSSSSEQKGALDPSIFH